MAVVDSLVTRLERRGQDPDRLLVALRQSLDDLLQDQIGFGEARLLAQAER